MIRTSPLLALLASASLLGLSACKSTHEPAAEKHEGHGSAKAEKEEHEEDEGRLPAQPATSLSAAIATAQQSVPDGRVLQAGIEDEDGKTICSIVLASGDGLREVNIDGATGKILGTENEPLEEQARKLLGELGQDPAHAAIGAAQAIEAALAKAPGAWALATGLSHADEKLVYLVFLIDGKTAKVAEVAAADGNVQKLSDVVMEDEEEMEESQELEGGETPPAPPK